jgi:hypothetical protein
VAEPTAPAPAPNLLHAQLEQEAQRVLQEAKRAAVALCVMDPLAIWAECAERPQWLTPARKRQIEFAARAKQADALTRVFERLGYETNPRFNEFFNQRRLNFLNQINFISVDVSLDTFERYHRIDLTPTLRQNETHLPFVPLLLTRLQLVEITDGALSELCALLFEHSLSLVPQPNALDVSPITQLCAEDWGWYIPIKNEGFRLAICCGHQNGDDDEFLCFTDPDKPVAKKLFKKIDATEQLRRLVGTMEKILAADPGIRDVEWSGGSK